MTPRGRAGAGADLVLREISDGKARRRELRRRQVPEEVGLVLPRVRSLAEHGTAGGLVRAPPDVVACGDRVAAHPARAVPESRELHLRVAGRAGDGRVPGEVRAHERPHHALGELLLEIENVVGYVERPGHAPRIGKVVGGAAAAGSARFPRMVPELHGEAEDFVPLPLQQERRDRRVDAPRHGDGDAHERKLSVHSHQFTVRNR